MCELPDAHPSISTPPFSWIDHTDWLLSVSAAGGVGYPDSRTASVWVRTCHGSTRVPRIARHADSSRLLQSRVRSGKAAGVPHEHRHLLRSVTVAPWTCWTG